MICTFTVVDEKSFSFFQQNNLIIQWKVLHTDKIFNIVINFEPFFLKQFCRTLQQEMWENKQTDNELSLIDSDSKCRSSPLTVVILKWCTSDSSIMAYRPHHLLKENSPNIYLSCIIWQDVTQTSHKTAIIYKVKP